MVKTFYPIVAHNAKEVNKKQKYFKIKSFHLAIVSAMCYNRSI